MPSEYGFDCLDVTVRDGVAVAVIDHPPINLLDRALRADLDELSRRVERDDDVRVLVLRSADPEFFIAHADARDEVDRYVVAPPKRHELGAFNAMLERYRTMPKATIAQIEGRARGGGAELAAALDMRFAARGRALLSQPEVALGICPGGGATQRLPRLMGRGRALEVLLGCDDVDADLAERYGWVDRALEPEELGPFVDRLARRIASFPASAIRYTKLAVEAALPSPIPGLLEEYDCFNRSVVEPAASARLHAFLDAGGQTRDYERDLGARLADLPPA